MTSKIENTQDTTDLLQKLTDYIKELKHAAIGCEHGSVLDSTAVLKKLETALFTAVADVIKKDLPDQSKQDNLWKLSNSAPFVSKITQNGVELYESEAAGGNSEILKLIETMKQPDIHPIVYYKLNLMVDDKLRIMASGGHILNILEALEGKKAYLELTESLGVSPKDLVKEMIDIAQNNHHSYTQIQPEIENTVEEMWQVLDDENASDMQKHMARTLLLENGLKEEDREYMALEMFKKYNDPSISYIEKMEVAKLIDNTALDVFFADKDRDDYPKFVNQVYADANKSRFEEDPATVLDWEKQKIQATNELVKNASPDVQRHLLNAVPLYKEEHLDSLVGACQPPDGFHDNALDLEKSGSGIIHVDTRTIEALGINTKESNLIGSLDTNNFLKDLELEKRLEDETGLDWTVNSSNFSGHFAFIDVTKEQQKIMSLRLLDQGVLTVEGSRTDEKLNRTEILGIPLEDIHAMDDTQFHSVMSEIKSLSDQNTMPAHNKAANNTEFGNVTDANNHNLTALPRKNR